jgi:hypothetical protein
MMNVKDFKNQDIFGDKELITTIINNYGDYPDDSFINDDLVKMFTGWYKEQANEF